MNSEWFKDCKTVELRSERIKLVKAHQPLLDVIRKMLERRLEELEAERCKKLDYICASWPYSQADLNGSIRETKFFISLLDQEEVK